MYTIDYDASLLFDEDKVYIAFGNRQIRILELNEDLSGPKEGGLDRIAVSDDRNYCDQGVVQGGIVDTPEGKWYAVLFQDHGAAGRIPVLATALSDDFKRRGPIVDFEDGRKTVSEAYDSYGFKSCWQINHEPDPALITNNCERGILGITTGKVCESIVQAQNIFTQRMYFPKCRSSVTVDGSGLRDGDYAGISVFCGCRIGLFIYATKQKGGKVEFSDFVEQGDGA